VLKRRRLAQSPDDLGVAGKAAMLAFSDRQEVSRTPTQGNAAAIAEILSINSVPLAYLDGRTDSSLSPLFESVEFSREVERHRHKCGQWKEAFDAVRDLFLSNEVDYIFIKSPSLFPYTSGNLDVMVRERDFAKAGQLLERAGFVELRNIREPHKYLYKRLHCGKEVIAVHLHSRIFWGATFVDPDTAWSRSGGQGLFDDVVPSLSPEDCLLTTFAHSFYENSAIRLLDLCIAKHLVDSGKVEWSYLRRAAKDARWEEGLHLSVLAYERLHQAVFGGPLFPQDVLQDARQFARRRVLLRRAGRGLEDARATLPFYLPLATTKFLGYKKVLQSREFGGIHRRMAHLAKLLTEVLVIHILKVNLQKGMLIALSGIDGSGKTSYARALVEALGNCGLKASHVWTRVGSQKGFQTLAKRWTRKAVRSDSPADSLPAAERFQKTRAMLRQGWRSRVWKAVNLIDLCLFYNLALRLRLLKRQVVVCDRYVPDIFVDLHVYDERTPGTVWLRLLRHCLPRPAINILLTAPADLAMERSSDSDQPCMESLEIQTRLYGQAAEVLDLAVVDSAHRGFGEVCDDVVGRAVSQYYRRKCVWFGWDQGK
jgi:thymidylate kinase